VLSYVIYCTRGVIIKVLKALGDTQNHQFQCMNQLMLIWTFDEHKIVSAYIWVKNVGMNSVFFF
jgi:hypothetical protein